MAKIIMTKPPIPLASTPGETRKLVFKAWLEIKQRQRRKTKGSLCPVWNSTKEINPRPKIRPRIGICLQFHKSITAMGAMEYESLLYKKYLAPLVAAANP